MPITGTQYRQINVRSPFYVERTTTAAEVTLYLRVWTGSLGFGRPTAATYVINKDATGGKVIFEISELIRDYIEQGDSIYALNTCWVETFLQDTAIPDVSVTYLATEGYTIHTELPQKSGDAFVDSFVMLPKDLNGNYRLTGAKGVMSMCQIMTNATNTSDWRVVENYADGSNFQYGYTAALTGSSNTIIQTLLLSEDTVSVDFDLDGREATLYHDLFDCNKYNTPMRTDDPLVGYQRPSFYDEDLQRPVVLTYVNKHGAKNTFAFTLKHTEEITSSSQSFKRNVLNYDSVSSFNSKHSSRKILKDSKQVFTINTDYINEYYVEQLQELILSEYVWANIAHVSSNLIPVTLIDKKISKKNHVNDKLIQYTFKIEVARDYINTIR